MKLEMELIELIEKKLNKLQEMKADSKRQFRNIKEGNLDGIEYIIKKREQIAKEVNLIDADFLKIFEAIKKAKGVNDLSDLEGTYVKELQERILEVRSISKEIMDIDKKNIVSMEALIEDNKKDLKQVKDGKKLNNAYNPKLSGSIMIDDNY
ncbi:MAG: flagellar protein FlgN [Tissierellia bacterium]|nr:flagellar protein FlgN [Tissierellia bacterium]